MKTEYKDKLADHLFNVTREVISLVRRAGSHLHELKLAVRDGALPPEKIILLIEKVEKCLDKISD